MGNTTLEFFTSDSLELEITKIESYLMSSYRLKFYRKI
ncbi:hypothetical protein LEP1GSC170_2639 [Leptospira interrogans serovar Bataviae str. HAI135]|nr:hypothetical protein LEP1GSC170_2639 [Leptospira interrogans serovar Bataviae str. HAI135]